MKTVFTIEYLKKSKCAHLNTHILNTPNSGELKKKSKYNNKKCVVDEIEFDSIKEANRYKELKILRKIGAIAFLELQVQFELNGGGTHSLKYIADFVYTDSATGQKIVEDCKGMRTSIYKKKKRLMKKVHGIEILET